MPVKVCYHYPCIDGIWAAWAAHRSFVQRGIQDVQFIPNRVFRPCTIEELALEVLSAPAPFQTLSVSLACPDTVRLGECGARPQGSETVYLLDFVGPAGFCQRLAQAAKR